MQNYANRGHSILVLRYFGNKSVAGLVTARKVCDFGDELEGTVACWHIALSEKPPWMLRWVTMRPGRA